MRKLILMRGIPGSGKSTLARQIAGEFMCGKGKSVAICATDDFHMVDGEYVFDALRLHEFHLANWDRARKFMSMNVELVIIDNTNVRRRDMKPYIETAEHFRYTVEEVIIGKGQLLPSLDDASPHKFNDYIDLCTSRNTHSVPRDVIEKMARRFQE